jgi:hypothetical protein
LILILKKIGKNKTKVNAYGNGRIGQKKIPEWFNVFRSCEKSDSVELTPILSIPIQEQSKGNSFI